MATDARAGTALGAYRIEELLGHGGMGVVYLATDTRLNRKVALKILAPQLASDTKFRERFVRESQLAASIDHPNIIPIYEAGETAGELYIAMRYVQGRDLGKVLAEEGALSPQRALVLLRQVASGLDEAHATGLIHRDIKPANILVTPGRAGGEHAYLSDFGLTKRTTSRSGLTGTGEFLGSVDYVAPEQVQGKPVDGRADIYSLGCVAYECLTASKPFDRESDVAVMWAHVNEAPPQATSVAPELPPGVDAVLAHALAKEAHDRPSTATDLVEQLARVLAVGPRGAEVPQPEVASARWRSRRLPAAPAVLAVVLAVGAAAVGSWFAFARPEQAPRESRPAGVQTPSLLVVGDEGSKSFATDGDPTAMAVDAAGAAWIAHATDASIERIEPEGTSTTFHLTSGPTAIAAGEGGVWAVLRFDSSVVKLDPETGDTDRIELDAGVDSIAVGDGRAWVGNASTGTLTPIDAETLRAGRAVKVGAGPGADIGLKHARSSVTYADGAVWMVTNYFDAHVTRVDTDSLKARRFAVSIAEQGFAPEPPDRREIRLDLAASEDQVWVASNTSYAFRGSGATPLQQVDLPSGDRRLIGGRFLGTLLLDIALDSSTLWILTVDGRLLEAAAAANCPAGFRAQYGCSVAVEHETDVPGATALAVHDGRAFVTSSP